MNESYAEHLISRKSPFYAPILTIVLGLCTAVSVFFAMTTGVLAVILMFGFGILTYLCHRNTHVEYEYLYVDKMLSIDIILGKSKRKKGYECTMDEIQVIAPEGSDRLNNYGTIQKTLDYTSHDGKTKPYVAIVESSGTTIKLIFEPDEKMLKCFRQTAPQKTFLQ